MKINTLSVLAIALFPVIDAFDVAAFGPCRVACEAAQAACIAVAGPSPSKSVPQLL